VPLRGGRKKGVDRLFPSKAANDPRRKSLLRMRHFPEIAKRDSVQHHMRREAGAVRGYGQRLFTQAHARRLVAQDPIANDRITSVQLRLERQFLSHETFGAISIADPREAAAGADEFDVRAFARIERLARIAAEPCKSYSECGLAAGRDRGGRPIGCDKGAASSSRRIAETLALGSVGYRSAKGQPVP
jgi:hypothetical protein